MQWGLKAQGDFNWCWFWASYVCTLIMRWYFSLLSHFFSDRPASINPNTLSWTFFSHLSILIHIENQHISAGFYTTNRIFECNCNLEASLREIKAYLHYLPSIVDSSCIETLLKSVNSLCISNMVIEFQMLLAIGRL